MLQLDINIPFLSHNKSDLLKLSKVHLYTSMMKSDKFKNVMSLMSQANIMWNEMTKNTSIYIINILN